MTDSDAVILLDTPRFRTSRWTKDELMFANENNIHILDILWPQQKEEGIASFNAFIKLAPKDFRMKGLSRSGIPYTGKNITKRLLKILSLRPNSSEQEQFLLDINISLITSVMLLEMLDIIQMCK